LDHDRIPLLTTKITKDTKVSEILFLNFVLFVSFVVKAVFASLVAASRCWFSVVNTDSNLHGS